MKQAFLAVTAALLLGTVPAAQAVATLSFSVDGGAAITCADGDACDANATTGAVTFIGNLAGVFDINVTTGITKPVALFDGTPLMDLNSINVITGSGTHTLAILFSEIDFEHAGQFAGLTGGTLTSGAGASIVAEVYYDAANMISATTTLAGSIGPFGPGAFSGTFAGALAPLGAPYSVTQALRLTTVGASSFSADFEVSVPEPTTLALLGLGLLAFGAGWRRQAV